MTWTRCAGLSTGWSSTTSWTNIGVLQVDEAREKKPQLRSVQAKLRRIIAMDPRPLTQPRPFSERLVGNCRDELQLLCSFLRFHGIPARARVRFQVAGPRKLDHVICEVWSCSAQRWQTVDVQMDNMQRERQRLSPEAQQYLAALTPQDTPPGNFLSGGQALAQCRAGEDDPQTIPCITDDLKGWWFMRNNMLRDLLALNKYELIPWDTIPGSLMCNDRADPTPEEYSFLDRVAEITELGDLARIQKLYAETPSLHIPSGWLEE